ncbi:MAG TPA: sorbosone dehydrogenase family protein [Croceibacterium sp.]|nr:sorbosone dehydrogenase family protein [Croceibacterium sp.]
MRRVAFLAGALAPLMLLAACGKGATVPEAERYGPNPTIPAPDYAAFPPIRIATVTGWPQGKTPVAAPGLNVVPFATGLIHPRWILPLPNGDVLVAETDYGIEPIMRPKGLVMKFLMGGAKGGGPTPPNRISLLRDTDGDGRADSRITYIDGLTAPIGMALVGDTLYVADTDKLMRYRYAAGADHPLDAGTKITDLPGGPIDHHWTKNVIASPDGSRLYVSVGSNSNVSENGMENEVGRAAIWEVDPATGAHHIFASGLRNPNGMGWQAGKLWTVVNERDEIGDDASPDYLTSVRAGAFYGWPWVYWGTHVDARAYPPRPDMVAKAIKPDYGLAAHTASLGLTFADGAALGPRFASGAFVGQHGSWNRSHPSGYHVIFVPFAGGKPTGLPVEVLGGFLHGKEVYGRPVGVAIDRSGALLVADDAGNTVWRVTAAQAAPAPSGNGGV